MKSPDCLWYIGDYTAKLYGDYNNKGSLLNNQYFMESKAFFFAWQYMKHTSIPQHEGKASGYFSKPNSTVHGVRPTFKLQLHVSCERLYQERKSETHLTCVYNIDIYIYLYLYS